MVVDSGDLLNEDEEIPESVQKSAELKAETIAQIYKQIGIDAVDVGELDLVLGVKYLKDLEKKLGDAAEVLGEGYIVGAYALMLRKCAEMNIPAITLLTQSFYNYPDPEAAAAALNALNKILGLKVETSDLLQKGEEIRLRAKDVMKRTQAEMAKMGKSQEYEVPALYG